MFTDLEFIKTCLNGLRSRIENIILQVRNFQTSVNTMQTSVNTMQTSVNTMQTIVKTKMDKDNPTCTGSFSLNRGSYAKVGRNSFAAGFGITASGNYSHAVGLNTTASGNSSHAAGSHTTASGNYSHAEGHWTTASGDYSYVEGLWTIASSQYQHVQGKYNIEDTANIYADIIGNGASKSARSNAATVDWKGNAWFSGNVFVGGASQNDGVKLLKTGEAIPIPSTASVGQVLVVKAVDSDGKPTEWETQEPGSSGVSSWNDLTDKPFYEESKTFLEWDGDATGHETIEFVDGLSLVYLGDSIIDPSVLIGATATITNGVDEASTVINGDDIQKESENVYTVAVGGSGFYLVTADSTTAPGGDTSFTFPYAGIYMFPKELFDGNYFSSIVKTVIKKIDKKFLPTVCGKTADAEGNISLEASDVGAAKLFVVTETSDGVVDKSGEQIRDAYLAGNVVILVPRGSTANIMYLLTVGRKGTFNPEGYKFFSVGISSDINIPYFRTATVYSNNTVKYKTEELARYVSSRSSITLDSSTEGSTKRFNITVDDSGTISAKEI